MGLCTVLSKPSTLFQNLDVAQQRVRSHAVSSIPGLGPSAGPGASAVAGPRGANPGGAPGSKMDEEDVE